MHIAARLALAVVILVFDFLSFLVPLGSMVIAWVIIGRPRWARDFIDTLYAGKDWPVEDAPNGPPSDATTGDDPEGEPSATPVGEGASGEGP